MDLTDAALARKVHKIVFIRFSIHNNVRLLALHNTSFCPALSGIQRPIMLKWLACFSLWLVLNPQATADDAFDNVLKSAHPLWLRERCTESWYVDRSTFQPLYNLHKEKVNLTVTDIAQMRDDAKLVITFSDGKACRYVKALLEAELNDAEFSTLQV